MEYQNYLSLLYEENQKRGCPCISPETGEFLHFLVQALKAQRILEIGTCLGYSTLWLSKDFKGTVTTLEKNCLSFEEAQKHFKKIGVSTISPLLGDAKTLISTLTTPFDFIFIDAIKKEYVTYIQLLEKNKLLQKRCLIVADNITSHADLVQDYVTHMEKNYQSVLVPVGSGLLLSVQR